MKKSTSTFFVLVISCMSFGQVFASQDKIGDDFGQEAYRSSICAIASQGAFMVAVERQKGSSKQAAKARLDAALAELKKQFHHKIFLDKMTETWYADLDRIYAMDVIDGSQEKAAFAYMLEELSYSMCVGKEPAINF